MNIQRTHKNNLALLLGAAMTLSAIGVPAAVSAMEGTPQVSGQVTKIEGDRFTIRGDTGQDPRGRAEVRQLRILQGRRGPGHRARELMRRL